MKPQAPDFDLDRGPRLAARILLAGIAVFLGLALVWMSVAQLDISARPTGQVIPSTRVQLIQSLEGGIVRQIAVQAGQPVRQGEVLALVENLRYDAELGQELQTQWAMQAAIARLSAEVEGRAPNFPNGLRAQAAEQVEQERRLWMHRLRQRDDALEAVRRQIAQRREELAEVQARIESLGRLLATARETLAMEDKLLAQGAGARADFLRARQEVERLNGELEAAHIAIPRVQAAIDESRARAAQVVSTHKAEASRELSELEARLAGLQESLAASQDRVVRRSLRAPADGVVNRVLVSTVGGVARAGETIMELVPVDDTLLIAARVRPADIAFVRPGQPVTVRITAFDSAVFGSLPGTVARVGADAIHDERQDQHYFEVVIETERNYLGHPEERLTISPGMTADVSIHTGQRTLLEYLFKPVAQTLDRALQER